MKLFKVNGIHGQREYQITRKATKAENILSLIVFECCVKDKYGSSSAAVSLRDCDEP
jgi:hypothetical protein